MTFQPRFNGVELTPETILRTRHHFADISRQCIEAARSGEDRVNDLPGYIAWREAAIADIMDESDTRFSVTFLQRAHYLQTGESVALLP